MEDFGALVLKRMWSSISLARHIGSHLPGIRSLPAELRAGDPRSQHQRPGTRAGNPGITLDRNR